ncbi:MAG TPA: alkaline phosphatase [Prolixibacteraceae bacterium]|nr:alkaline phosphatase [Prolixibacteraceae bacterium]
MIKRFSNYLLLFLFLGLTNILCAQEEYKTFVVDSLSFTSDDYRHEVTSVAEPRPHKRPKNVILMIGDGMGLTHIFAGMVANGGNLYLKNISNIGFITTHSHNRFVTDSGAGGTALACGVKTYNGAIGVDKDTLAAENIREKAEKKGRATGVVSTSAVTHATPASFVAHQPSRNRYEAIASDFLKSNIDLFIGGGMDHFNKRKDSVDFVLSLKEKGYTVLTSIDAIEKTEAKKMAGFTSSGHNPGMLEGRGNILPRATQSAIRLLNRNKKGFFLMVEGSQIDWGSHENFTAYLTTEVLDFDQAIGEVLKFAARDGETLVVVTADHETGGFSVENGSYEKGDVYGDFTSDDHTGTLVPVYAFGPGSEYFRGFHDNTDIPKIIARLAGW